MPLHPATQGTLQAAADFLMTKALADSTQFFIDNHAPMFDGTDILGSKGPGDIEHRLIDVQLEAFVTSQPFSQEEFLSACQDALDHGEGGFANGVVQNVLMASSYDFFVQMMIEAAAGAAAARAREDYARSRHQGEPAPEEAGVEMVELRSAETH
jgi:hypothetical protein